MCGSEIRLKDHFCSSCGAQLTQSARPETRSLLARPETFSAAGIFMLVLGALVGVFGYFIGIIPILALGLGSLLLGVIILSLPEPTASKTGRLIILSSLPSLLDIDALIEDLDIGSRGIYIPVSGFGNVPKVLLPIKESTPPLLPPARLTRSRRVFLTLGKSENERGILLNPPGGEVVSALENLLQVDLSTIKMDEFAARIGFGFETLNISSRAVALESVGTAVRVDVRSLSIADLEERLRSEAPRLIAQIGSPVTSAIAAAISKVTGNHVRINDSNFDGSRLRVSLEVLESGSV